MISNKKVAIVTMVYNEPDYLPIWIKYYSKQVEEGNLYVIDHGSDDGSTADLNGVNVLRIPRSPQDDPRRARFVSSFCSALLEWYETVLYVDIDEIAVADPRYYRDLAQLCSTVSAPALNAIGVNVLHLLGHETAFESSRNILTQRSWVFRSSSMCKPILIRRPVVWAPGFHSADSPAAFDHLFLFHLRWFDLDTGLRRLAKTREMPWQHADAGAHQKISDEQLVQQFQGFCGLPLDYRDLDASLPPVSEFTADVLKSQAGRENDTFRISLDIWPDSLWQIPERFKELF